MSARLGLTALAVVVLGSGGLSAQVEWITRADGTRVLKGKGRPLSSMELRDPSVELMHKIEHYAVAVGLDSKLVQCLIQAESAFNPWAVSVKGAQGLMQLMPTTAAELGVDDPFDIDQNLDGGTRYLKQLLDRYDGDLILGLAAYNAGPEAVQRFRGVPPYRETRDYVQRILTMYRGDAPLIPSGSLRGRPAFLVRKDGRWLVTSDRTEVEQAQRQPRVETEQSRGQRGGG